MDDRDKSTPEEGVTPEGADEGMQTGSADDVDAAMKVDDPSEDEQDRLNRHY
jgi:hypothetical protein